MAKCKKCKSGWFFSTVSENGLCKKCNIKEQELYKKKERELYKIEEKINSLKIKEVEIEQKLNKKILDINNPLVIDAKRESKLKKMFSLYNAIIKGEQKNIDDFVMSINDISILLPTVNLKLNCMDIKELRKKMKENKEHVQNVLERYKDRYTTKANISIYSLMVIALEAELQNILYNLKYEKLEISVENIKKMTAKYELIAVDGNKAIANTIKKFIGEIEYLFIEAIQIEYEYYVQKERLKEEQRVLREQMRQEAAELKALEEQRKKIEKEESKFLAEIIQIKHLIEMETDKIKIKQLEERVERVDYQLKEVEKNKEQIINLQHGKAGYVYIISNLGSFGDNVFKIGMTRRLDPQERIDELGSASVPFRFDVHSFIFSEKAPELENAIHKKLNSKRVNKVNLRKEFFKCSLDELESLVYELEPSAIFNRTMLAEQYVQGLSINEVPDEILNASLIEEDE